MYFTAPGETEFHGKDAANKEYTWKEVGPRVQEFGNPVFGGLLYQIADKNDLNNLKSFLEKKLPKGSSDPTYVATKLLDSLAKDNLLYKENPDLIFIAITNKALIKDQNTVVPYVENFIKNYSSKGQTPVIESAPTPTPIPKKSTTKVQYIEPTKKIKKEKQPKTPTEKPAPTTPKPAKESKKDKEKQLTPETYDSTHVAPYLNGPGVIRSDDEQLARELEKAGIGSVKEGSFYPEIKVKVGDKKLEINGLGKITPEELNKKGIYDTEKLTKFEKALQETFDGYKLPDYLKGQVNATLKPVKEQLDEYIKKAKDLAAIKIDTQSSETEQPTKVKMDSEQIQEKVEPTFTPLPKPKIPSLSTAKVSNLPPKPKIPSIPTTKVVGESKSPPSYTTQEPEVEKKELIQSDAEVTDDEKINLIKKELGIVKIKDIPEDQLANKSEEIKSNLVKITELAELDDTYLPHKQMAEDYIKELEEAQKSTETNKSEITGKTSQSRLRDILGKRPKN